MPNERQPHIQFRLDWDTFALVEERVAELHQQGVKTSPSLYCRALVLAALGQPENVALANDLSLRAQAVSTRAVKAMGAVLKQHLEEIVQAAMSAALTPSDDG